MVATNKTNTRRNVYVRFVRGDRRGARHVGVNDRSSGGVEE
jgi:hypothetical protein